MRVDPSKGPEETTPQGPTASLPVHQNNASVLSSSSFNSVYEFCSKIFQKISDGFYWLIEKIRSVFSPKENKSESTQLVPQPAPAPIPIPTPITATAPVLPTAKPVPKPKPEEKQAPAPKPQFPANVRAEVDKLAPEAGGTILHTLCKQPWLFRAAHVEYILSKGLDINAKDNDQKSAIDHLFLQLPKVTKNHKDVYEITVAMFNAKALINPGQYKETSTPLFYWSFLDLLNRDCHFMNFDPIINPIHYAVSNKIEGIIPFLALKHPKHELDPEGRTAFCFALEKWAEAPEAYTHIVDQLFGFSLINSQKMSNSNSQSPLHFVALCKAPLEFRLPLVKRFIKENANLEALDAEGRTVLGALVEKMSVENNFADAKLVLQLTSNKANWYVPISKNSTDTIWDVAARSGLMTRLIESPD